MPKKGSVVAEVPIARFATEPKDPAISLNLVLLGIEERQLKLYLRNWKIFSEIVKEFKNLNIVYILWVSRAYSQRGFNECW